jgi:pilus assembly protein CpaE
MAVFTVFSSKGGTGKTFLATNLAAALATRSDLDTALVDLNLDMGDVFATFGTEPTGSLVDLASGELDAETVLAAGTELGPHLWGFATSQGSPADLSGEGAGRILRAIRSHFAIVVIDGPGKYDDRMLAALELSDAVLVIAGLDVVALRHMSSTIGTLHSLGIPRDRVRVVINRSDSRTGIEISQVERVMRIKMDALIPSSRLVPTALNNGIPVYLLEPTSGVARAIDAFAETLLP